MLILNHYLVVEKFRSWLQEDHNLAEAMAGVKALTEVVRSSKGILLVTFNRNTH